MRYPRASRLTRRGDIDRVKREGRALRTGDLIARASPSPFSRLRVGIVVPRYQHSAVDRNRLKRRLREIVRVRLLTSDARGDLVIWARPRAYDRTYAELEVALVELWRRMGETASVPPQES